jgi:hypothetical protein
LDEEKDAEYKAKVMKESEEMLNKAKETTAKILSIIEERVNAKKQ